MQELIKAIKKRCKNRSHNEIVALLHETGIIDNDGFLSPRFYSEEVVEADRKLNNPIKIK